MGSIPSKYIRQIEMVQHRAARFILGKPWRRHERDSITDVKSTEMDNIIGTTKMCQINLTVQNSA